MKSELLALLLFASMLPRGSTALAQNEVQQPASGLCFRNSQKLLPGSAAAGEYKVIHGPYTSSRQCATAEHWFTLRTQHGMRWPLTVEQWVDAGWVVVINKELDPHKILGGGVFRMILDNRNRSAPVFYKGSYSVPL